MLFLATNIQMISKHVPFVIITVYQEYLFVYVNKLKKKNNTRTQDTSMMSTEVLVKKGFYFDLQRLIDCPLFSVATSTLKHQSHSLCLKDGW